MRRFLISDKLIFNNRKILIECDEFRHIVKVCRNKAGDEIILTDGKGREFLGVIDKIHPKNIEVLLIKERQSSPESKINLTLFQSLLKKNKFDFVVQKCTELGLKEIVPIITERCERIPKNEKILERWRKIAKSASCQSGRINIPEINPPEMLSSVMNKAGSFDVNLVFFEGKKNEKLRTILQDKRDYKKVSIWIGPEGGFSKKEIDLFNKGNFKIAGLGSRILRAETAAIVSVALVLYELGE